MKKYFKLFVVAILILCSAHVMAEQLTPQRTVVAGRIFNRSSTDQRVITVNFCDPLSEDQIVAVRLNDRGEFFTSAAMCFAQNITIVYGGSFINLFVNPSDSVFLEIDMYKVRAGDRTALRFFGSGAKLNNQFAPFANYLYSLKCPKLNLEQSPKALVDQIKISAKMLEDSIATYATRYKLMPFIRQWASRDIIYRMANEVLDYQGRCATDQLELFADPIFGVDNPENFVTTLYSSHLNSYLYAILRSDPNYMSAFAAQNMDMGVQAGLKAVLGVQSTLVREVMLYMFMRKMLAVDTKYYKDISNIQFTNRFISDRIEAMAKPQDKLGEYIQSETEGILYLSSGVNKTKKIERIDEPDFLKYLKAKYPKRVIYIDIWATWCGPCIAEFSPAKELRKLYAKDDDKVVFVNLCLASKPEAWLVCLAKYQIEGQNYFFNDDATAIFVDSYNVEGYPTFMLIDTRGNIVSKNAPSPSNISGASAAIDKLIK